MDTFLNKLFKRLSIEGLEQKALIKGAGSSFMIKVIGAGLAFIAQLILARLLGVTDYGAYIFIYSCLTVLVIPARLGFDNSLVRFIPEYNKAGQWNRLKGILSFAYKSVIGVSFLIAALAIAATYYWSDALESYSVELIVGAAVGLPVLALLHITRNSIRGFKAVTKALLPKMVIMQLVLIAGLLGIYYFGGRAITAEQAMGITVSALAVALGCALYFLKKQLPAELKRIKSSKEYRYWLSITLPMLLITGMYIVLSRTDLIMIGSIQGQEAAGVYGAVTKVSDLVVFGLQAVNIIAAPLIAELYHAGKTDQLQSLVTLATRGAFLISLIVSVIFVLFGDFILGLFGAEFTLGYWALLILLVAQMVNAFSGSVGFIMTMTGHQNRVAIILGVSAVINIGLNFLLVPLWGIEGGAVATGVSMVCWNIAMIIYVHKNLNINSTIF
jgi:O-antigen/teichoic acid export membrane protein